MATGKIRNIQSLISEASESNTRRNEPFDLNNAAAAFLKLLDPVPPPWPVRVRYSDCSMVRKLTDLCRPLCACVLEESGERFPDRPTVGRGM